jgi:5'-deoxynucleotidase YfbR-like HD superfamily hydrolase
MAEIVTGDLPFPFKATHPEIKELLEPIEEQVVVRLGGPKLEIEEYLKRRIKACDLLEMLEFGLVEVNLGNRFAEPIVYDIEREIRNFAMNAADFLAINVHCEKIMEDYECAPTRITPIARTATR